MFPEIKVRVTSWGFKKYVYIDNFDVASQIHTSGEDSKR